MIGGEDIFAQQRYRNVGWNKFLFLRNDKIPIV